ncbi:uncharacterized protein ACLA_019040 [Aspergillus clavatus NRRL 1]|uniref:CENP-S associating centromere protein X-domain-containing protein n=1 Tax=Aspergillus clavatus (strain ATCC 1007 / CBS 513.65 / DSM 816 / NCTC 3887 / NRRL 1 / QM 1276 / 107) TaxID=344612 RepID=A1CNH8_ASPCL|nr:uncharacterized protein ACLA_019040 [Aspergillus clavatus NRRL 1]EAW07199.1 conserved hypothetical protein [Aspergillus clavatus NRRL 1]
MPPERQNTQKRRRLPFNPPRPRDSTSAAGPSTASSSKTKPPAKASKTTANATASSSKSTRKPAAFSSRSKAAAAPRPAVSASVSVSDSASQSGAGTDSGSESDSRGRERSLSGEPEYILAEITNNEGGEDVMSSEPAIPPKLLTRLLHHHFKSEKTKLAKDANTVVAKYVDIFVREALARAAYERAEGLGGGIDGSGGRMPIGDGFLEVEDLEKMAPQLALDF